MENELRKRTEKRKVAFVIDYCEDKGLYVCERAAMLANTLINEELFVFLKDVPANGIDYFTKRGLTPVLFDHMRELPKVLRNLQINCIIYEGKNSAVDNVQMILPFCETLVHFDDFGDGSQLATCNIISLYEEPHERLHSNQLCGSYAFMVPESIAEMAKTFNYPALHALPHIVICFEDGDKQNLTYRTLRHLTQLHIPLQITVVLDEQYQHAADDLQLMLLSRRETTLLRGKDALLQVLADAHIVIGNACFTPYKVATLGIPYIAAAQNDRELANAFVREENGIIQIGLGRKMKQSHIQNAVMELLLHGSRRERAIRKQCELNLIENKDILQPLVHDFVHQAYNITHI